jgi:hypothetical protein
MLLLPDWSEFQARGSIGGVRKMNGGAIILRAHNGYRADHSFAGFRRFTTSEKYAFTGIYQYLVHDVSVFTQAREFCDVIGTLHPWEIPILDIEDPKFPAHANLWTIADQWCDFVDTELGLKKFALSERAWVYSAPAFIEAHGLLPIFESQRRTWLGNYASKPAAIGHTLWQSTDGVHGVNRRDWPGAGFCDTSVFNGNLAQLAACITRKTPPATPPKAPPPPPPKAVPKEVITKWITAGDGSLLELAAQLTSPAHRVTVGTILAFTAEHSPGGVYEPKLEAYIDHGDFTETLPVGITLYYEKEEA